MDITPEIKDAVNSYIINTKTQMGIIEPIIVYYSWEEVDHLDHYPMTHQMHYNKVLGWTDKVNGNRCLLVNIRMHQSFITIFKTIVHELFHIKFPLEHDEFNIEKFATRWLETKHNDFGFFYDEKFFQEW